MDDMESFDFFLFQKRIWLLQQRQAKKSDGQKSNGHKHSFLVAWSHC